MTPLAWAGIAVALFIGAALVIRSLKSAETGQASSLAAAGPVAQLFAAPEPLRVRSQFDVETDEDLAVINDVYREQRKAERARQALERLAPLVPVGAVARK